ncbi:ferredoxin [Embleya scabrispora]|uniref:ferredoxin n=1 Tax=Embleya scabrispora TaxID=159449 RepID=UPI00037814D9|nr:ferredoxin [Embleya scabrispora]MYS81526.1 ferredoxin [Streptomyces sp. SID5474]
MTPRPPTPSSNGSAQGPTHAHVDLDLCIASGICAATAPTHFTQAPNGQARVRPDAPPPTTPAEDAAALCPVEAITLTRAPAPHPPPKST